MEQSSKVVIQTLDLMDITKKVAKRTKRMQATLLSNIETILESDSSEYKQIRKLILDSTNNFSRSVISGMFGDIEL